MSANLLGDYLRAAGRDRPEACAIQDGSGIVVTYGLLDERSAQLAHVLRAEGVSPGDRVAVQTATRAEVLILSLACARIAAIYVPLNPRYTDHEVLALLDDAGPGLLVREAPLDHATPRITLDELVVRSQVQPTTFADAPADESTPAALLFTSGTTGRPKGVVLTHGNLVANCDALRTTWGFRDDDVLLHVLPLFHVHGLFVAAYCALASGAAIDLLGEFDVDEVLGHLPTSTVFMGVPTHYVRLLDDGRFGADQATHIRLFTSGSAPMLLSTHREFSRRTGRWIVERYGMTETGILTSNPIDGTHRVGTVGRPLADVELRLAGPGSDQVEVRGPNVFSGYWNRPELLTTEFTDDGWFRTGDLGSIDADGFLTLQGRSKDLIISGGFNVYPKEVELVLDELDDVAESAVVGLPDPDLGEVVVAAIVACQGRIIDENALRTAAREHLAGYKVPRRLVVVDALPRNTMGKVEKSRVRSWLLEPTRRLGSP